MPEIMCALCQGKIRSKPIVIRCDNQASLRGIVRCLECGHELPITVTNDYIQEIAKKLPNTQSDRLNESIAIDIKDDVQEAERANYS